MNTRKLKQWFFRDLSTSARRSIIMVGIGLIACSLFYMSDSGRVASDRRAKPQKGYEIQAPEMAQEVMSEKLANDVNRLERQVRDLTNSLDLLREKQKTTPSSVKKGQGSLDVKNSTAALDLNGFTAGDKKLEALLESEGVKIPVADPLLGPELILPDNLGNPSGKMDINEFGKLPVNPPVPTPTPQAPAQGQQQNSKKAGPEKVEGPPPAVLGIVSYQPAVNPNDLATQSEKRADSFYIPSASFFAVKLITGLDAPTGQKAKTNPSPLALRIQDLAWLPNEVRTNVEGCFILAEAVGELSTERVSARGLSISCVNKDGNTVIDQKMLGYLADGDGKSGLRGVVVSKAGKVLAEGMKVGFLQGLSDFFNYTSRNYSSTAEGTVISNPTDGMGSNLLGGAFSGVGSALEKVSDYYMSLADEIFPVIEVHAARSATFVVTQGTEVVFDKKLVSIGKNGNNYDEL